MIVAFHCHTHLTFIIEKKNLRLSAIAIHAYHMHVKLHVRRFVDKIMRLFYWDV